MVDTNGDYDEFFVFVSYDFCLFLKLIDYHCLQKFDVYSRAVCPGGFKGSSSSIVGGIGIAIIVM